MWRETMQQVHNKLIVLTGPSGAGKSTLVHRLLFVYGPRVLGTTVSYTTRPRRGVEKEGIDYYFVNKATFLSLRKQKFFIEWSYVYGNYYATAKQELEKHIKQKKAIIKDFDLKGAHILKNLYPHSLVVFIAPPSIEELSRRLNKRQENNPKDIQVRIQQAKEELEQANLFDQKVENKDLKQTEKDLKKMIDPYLSHS